MLKEEQRIVKMIFDKEENSAIAKVYEIFEDLYFQYCSNMTLYTDDNDPLYYEDFDFARALLGKLIDTEYLTFKED